MNREEHLRWAKARAYEYCDAGNVNDAFASFVSDLGKHPKLAEHPEIGQGMMMMVMNQLSTPQAMRKWIEGFN